MKKKAPIKICILGLDNAGKTTILEALTKMYNFEEEIRELAPTIQIKYHKRFFLNVNCVFWDFGGQERFRATYLNDNFFFLGINALIFVIDIQDEVRFPMAIDYLKGILQIIKNDEEWMAKKEPINICFSKVDVNLISENRVDYESRMEMLENIIRKDFPEQIFKFFATSIYNLYSIVHLVSQTIQSYLTFSTDILKIFEEIQKNIGFNKCLVYDHTGIVIAEVDNQPVSYSYMDNTIHSIIGHHLRIFRQVEESDVHVKQTWDTDGVNSIFNTQFTLYDRKNPEHSANSVNPTICADPENKGNLENNERYDYIKNERELGNPFYQNYYFSLFVPKEKQKEGENIIPEVIQKIRSLLQKQFLH